MTIKQFWYVEQIGQAENYNDSSMYGIKNGKDILLVRYDDRKILDEVCKAHNKSLIEEDKQDG